MAKIFKTPIDLEINDALLCFYGIKKGEARIKLGDFEITELKPFKLQYSFKSACFMLDIKDTSTLKKLLEKHEIEWYKPLENDTNYIHHNDLVLLLSKMIKAKGHDSIADAVKDCYLQEKNDQVKQEN